MGSFAGIKEIFLSCSCQVFQDEQQLSRKLWNGERTVSDVLL